MVPPTASTSSLRLVSTTAANDNSEFVQFRATMRLPIAPIWGSTGASGGAQGSGGMDGVREVLAGWVMRYLPPLRAVLLTFNPIPTFVHPAATFPLSASPFPPPASSRQRDLTRLLKSPGPDDEDNEPEEPTTVELISLPMITGSGFALPTVAFEGLAWRPRIGQRIVGSAILSTPSHISLLLHNLFNASISVEHIPSDEYHFDEDFAVPDEIQKRQETVTTFPTEVVAKEVAAADAEVAGEEEAAGVAVEREVAQEKESEEMALERKVKTEEDLDRERYGQRGWWRRMGTNVPLGGASGRVEFVIIGLTISDSMISVTGSLLADPFAEAPAPKRAVSLPANKKRLRSSSSSSSSSSTSSSRASSPEPLRAPPTVGVAPLDSSSSESESKAEFVVKPVKKEKAKKEKVKKEKGVKKAKKV